MLGELVDFLQLFRYFLVHVGFGLFLSLPLSLSLLLLPVRLCLPLSLSLSPSCRLCLTWQLLQTALGVALSVGLAIALTGFVVIYYSTRLTQCFCACVLCIPSVLHHALAVALRGFSNEATPTTLQR